MRVGSSSDIYHLLVPRAKAKEPSEETQDQAASVVRGSGGTVANDEIAAAFLARLAQSNFARDDTNGDGFVDQKEYIEGKMATRSDGYQPNLDDVQTAWNKLDKDGKGKLSGQDYADGLSSMLQAAVGTFDKPLR